MLIRRPIPSLPAPLLVSGNAGLAIDVWEDGRLADANVYNSGEPLIAEEIALAESMVGSHSPRV